MQERFQRTQLLFGEEAMERLGHSRVAVFGIGGVGGHAVEVLARSGIGAIDIFDNDSVNVTNINRQIIALDSTVGRLKVDVAEERIRDINPDCIVGKHAVFYLPANAGEFDLTVYDYVLDCVDTVAAKIELARRCWEARVPLISCMGAANKMEATAFRVTDIYKTKMDPLAKAMRKKLREIGVKRLKVVCSEEQPVRPLGKQHDCEEVGCQTAPRHRPTPASNAFVPAAAGLIMGGEVVRALCLSVQE